MGDIVVPGALLTGASVILAFILTRGYSVLGGLLDKWFGLTMPALTMRWKQAVVFLVSVGLTGFFGVRAGFPLPDVAADPLAYGSALLAFGTLVFVSARPTYDILWKALLEAE